MSTSPIHPILVGEDPDPDELYANFKPVRYRYVLAYLHDESEVLYNADGSVEGTVLHKAGEVINVLPLTSVSYKVGMYSGMEFSGSIYLPDFYLDLMVHQPSFDFDRWRHPDQQGAPLGSMFECGNRAIYVLRNKEVVWGGILWTRSYSSGTPTLAVTALSFDGYVYYRLLRLSIVFSPVAVNTYTIWYAVLKQTLMDFTWPGVDTHTKKNGKEVYENNGRVTSVITEALSILTNAAGKITSTTHVPWTGLTRDKKSNVPERPFIEQWANNNPKIVMPDPTLKLYTNPTAAPASRVEVKQTRSFHGYDMATVGAALEEFADTLTITSTNYETGGSRFEYRVVPWYDSVNQVFKQRYVFGNMHYAPGKGADTDDPQPDSILSPFLGQNTQTVAKGPDNALIFDFPGHISSWSLNESHDGTATRVIAADSYEEAAKHIEMACQTDLLNVPPNDGSQGWLLYDHVESYDLSAPGTTGILTKLAARASTVLRLLHVAQAARVTDINAANGLNQRSSQRATDLQVTLYTTPDRPLPKFEVGDWATFAIEDPFYGGKMYLVRRIMGYTVTVVPEQESDYSHEQIELELTDDAQIELGGG